MNSKAAIFGFGLSGVGIVLAFIAWITLLIMARGRMAGKDALNQTMIHMSSAMFILFVLGQFTCAYFSWRLRHLGNMRKSWLVWLLVGMLWAALMGPIVYRTHLRNSFVVSQPAGNGEQ